MTQGGTDNLIAGGLVPVGERIGKYEVVERLGAGGQSIVYKARDPMLDRYVAIKQVPPHLAADKRFAERFRGVLRQLARLNCEQIVTVLELIEEPGGLFVVMEYVAGHTIETTLATTPGPVEVKAALQLIWRLAGGLAAIHKAGIIHRDIKPGNIIVGEGLRVKITDFGVAARAGVPASMKLGTTKYMAPELFTEGEIDARADIYSLGMVMYEMLLGRPKFNEIFQEVVRDPHSEALRWMKWHSSPEKSAPPLAEVNPEVPPALSAIVARMMAKDARDRFPNVEALGREIRANFSPRAQRPAQAGPLRRRVTIGAVAEAEDRLSRAAGAQAPEGDRLAIPLPAAAEPATAAIPTVPMSVRKKLAIAGAAAGVAVVALAVLLVQRMTTTEVDRRAAETALLDASGLYRKAAKAETVEERLGRFATAQAAFAKVHEKYGSLESVAGEAHVKDRMCQGHLCVLGALQKATVMFSLLSDDADKRRRLEAEIAADWNQAYDHLKKAQEYNNTLQRTLRDREARRRADAMGEEFNEFDRYVTTERRFVTAMLRGYDELEAGNFEEAEKTFEKQAGELAVHTDQQLRIQEIKRGIKEKLKQGEYRALMKEGDEQAAKGPAGVSAAVAKYNAAIAVLASKDVPAEVREDLKKTALRKIVTLQEETAFTQAVNQARAAYSTQGGGNRLAAADLWQKALAAGASAESKGVRLQGFDPAGLKTRIETLRHDHWVAEARRSLDVAKQTMAAGRWTNELKQTAGHIDEARKYRDSPEVAALAAEVRRLEDHRRQIGLAEQLIRQKKWEAALEQYNAALKGASGLLSRDVTDRITDCRFEIAVAKGNDLRLQQQWDRAVAEYQNARKIKPSEAAKVDAIIDMIKKEKAYTELMAEAEKMRKAGNWTEAIRLGREAGKVRATPDVEQLIDLVRYQQHLELCKTAMEERDWPRALGYANIARRFKSTPEVQALLKQIQEFLRQEDERREG